MQSGQSSFVMPLQGARFNNKPKIKVRKIYRPDAGLPMVALAFAMFYGGWRRFG